MDFYLMHAALDGWANNLRDFEQVKAKNIHEVFSYLEGSEVVDMGKDVLDYSDCIQLLKYEGYINESFGLTIKGDDLLKIFRFAANCDEVDFYDFESLLFCDAIEYFSKKMRQRYLGE